MIEIKDEDLKELKRIQDSIPKEWQEKLIMKRSVTPTMAKALSLFLHRKDLTPEQKEKAKAIKDSGILEQKEDVVNQSVQKKIDRYVSEEIEKSIKAGRLSERPHGKTH